MRAYERRAHPRFTLHAPREDRRPTPSSTRFRDQPASWTRFAALLERASGQTRANEAARRLARCGSMGIEHVFRCGGSEEALGAWCGHAFCPRCTRSQGARLAQEVRSGWSERVVSLVVPTRASGGLELPSASEVTELRAGFAQAAARAAELSLLPQLQSLPRTLIAPAGVTFFAPLPWARLPDPKRQRAAEATLATALRRGAREAGLPASVPAVASREATAIQLKAAWTQQADRFQIRVEAELARLEDLATGPWRASDVSLEAAEGALTSRWLERVRARQRRRQTLSQGGREALPLDLSPTNSRKKGVCAQHGGCCPIERTELRSSEGRVLRTWSGDALPQQPTGTQVARLIETPGARVWRRAG